MADENGSNHIVEEELSELADEPTEGVSKQEEREEWLDEESNDNT